MKDKLEKLNALEQDFGGEVAEIRSAVDGFHAAEAKMREKDRNLSISIVGRVKSGKSSFLNALLFKGESVLPQAATPMTAALTYIRYAPKCRAEVEFFTKKEWETFLEQSKKYDEILAQVRAKLVQEEEAAKKKAVAEFDFKKGLLVALFSGIASAGMNFGLQGGASMETAARLCGTDAKWIGLPVLVVVLWGGFVVNAAWCLWQNQKNRSFSDYCIQISNLNSHRGLAMMLAGLAGVIWACQFVCQKVGEPAMGEMRYISFAVVMGSCVMFSSLLGIMLGEWRGTGRKTRVMLAVGLGVLALSIVLAAVAKTF